MSLIDRMRKLWAAPPTPQPRPQTVSLARFHKFQEQTSSNIKRLRGTLETVLEENAGLHRNVNKLSADLARETEQRVALARKIEAHIQEVNARFAEVAQSTPSPELRRASERQASVLNSIAGTGRGGRSAMATP